MSDEIYFDDEIHMMEKMGGSFVKSLAACYYAADSTNKPRLRAAFSDYFDRYEIQFKNWRSERPPVASSCDLNRGSTK